tara:strand:- start:2104 stop:2379 length:276 start_codon:yes stop_codon:yes gene_type:complete
MNYLTIIKKVEKLQGIDLDKKIKDYFDSKFFACNPKGIEETNKRAKELLKIAAEYQSLKCDADFLKVWNKHFNIENEDYNDLQIDKVFYHR